MKKSLLLIPLFAAFGLTEEKEPKAIFVSNEASTAFVATKKEIVTSNMTIAESTKYVFSVTGLPQVQFTTAIGSILSYPTYQRPEKPEEVTCYVWTQDGRKWKAEWKLVEEKEVK